VRAMKSKPVAFEARSRDHAHLPLIRSASVGAGGEPAAAPGGHADWLTGLARPREQQAAHRYAEEAPTT